MIPVTLWDGHKIPLVEYAGMLASKTTRAKKNEDGDHKKATGNFNMLPTFIAEPVLFGLTYLALQLGFQCKPIGMKNDTFGHSVLTNVGPLGFK